MKSLLLYTNVLLLYLIGNRRPELIGEKRLKQFDSTDRQKTNELCKKYSNHKTLPNILTEASNILGSGRQEIVPGAAGFLKDYVRDVSEIFEASSVTVADPAYLRLGLTDAAILRLSTEETIVMTVDFELCNKLEMRGVGVVNLMRLKTPNRRERS